MLNPRRATSLLRRTLFPSPGGLSLAPAEAIHRRAIEAIVATAPVASAHVGSYLEEGLRHGAGLFVVLDGDRVIAAIQRVRGISWALDPGHEAEQELYGVIARFLERWTSPQEVVFGPERTVMQALELASARGLTAAELRQQVLMRNDAPVIPPAPPELTLRPAQHDDLAWLLTTHSAMCREDLGTDQVARNPEGYRRHFLDLISRSLCTVGLWGGERVFKCEAPVVSDQAFLFEGVYTLPAARGRGIASSATAQLALQAIGRGFIPALYVHRRNRAALRVYAQIGFREIGPWTTTLITREPPRPEGPLMW